MIPNTMCTFPFGHQHINPDGQILTCCAIVTEENFNVQTHTLSDEWNSNFKKQLRLDLIDGKKPEACSHCWHLENNDNTKGDSMRLQSALNLIPVSEVQDRIEYAKNNNGYLDKIAYNFQIMPGNLCNLACKMCQPKYSTTFSKFFQSKNYKNENEIIFVNDYLPGEKTLNFIGDVYDWPKKKTLHEVFSAYYNDIKEIIILGGEPTIVEENLDFLQELINHGLHETINLAILTNGTNLNKKFYDIILKFKNPGIVMSLDGMDEIAYIQRYPSNWASIEGNLKKLYDKRKIGAIRTTVTSLNFHHVPYFWEYILINYPGVHINTQHLSRNYTAFSSINFGIEMIPQSIADKVLQKTREIKHRLPKNQWNIFEIYENVIEHTKFSDDYTTLYTMLDHMQTLHPELDIKKIYSIYYTDSI